MSNLANRMLAVGLLAALAGCADAPTTVARSESPIIGGTTPNVGDYPNVVALLIGGSLCTGTLVAPNVVATAAHCVEPAELGVSSQADVTAQTRVVFDRVDLRAGGGFAVGASSTLPNPGFDINNLGQHDIGIVILSQRVTDRAPAPITREVNAVQAGSSVTLVGYGISQVVGGTADDTSAGVEHVLADKATVSCSIFGASDKDLICFDQTDGKGSCNGDSGGPAFSFSNGKNTLSGITSFGDQNCVQAGAYTRVTAEIAFLEQQMNGADACSADGVCTPACGAGSLPADPDCGSSPPPGTSPPPSTNPPATDPGSNPTTDPNDPSVGDAPGLTGGCSILPGSPRRGSGDPLLEILALGVLSFVLLSRVVRHRR